MILFQGLEDKVRPLSICYIEFQQCEKLIATGQPQYKADRHLILLANIYIYKAVEFYLKQYSCNTLEAGKHILTGGTEATY